jgi:hypothetical protein
MHDQDPHAIENSQMQWLSYSDMSLLSRAAGQLVVLLQDMEVRLTP